MAKSSVLDKVDAGGDKGLSGLWALLVYQSTPGPTRLFGVLTEQVGMGREKATEVCNAYLKEGMAVVAVEEKEACQEKQKPIVGAKFKTMVIPEEEL